MDIVEPAEVITAVLEEPVKKQVIKNAGYYKEIITKDISPEVFKPNPARLVGFFLLATFSLASFFLIVNLKMIWPLKLALGLFLGYCNGLLAFIGHEISHGSVVKNKKLQDFLFFFGVSPFFISPTFWRFWHNRLHHGKTQQLIQDPDAYPNFRIFKASKFMQFMYPFTPGSGHKRSLSYFFFWFSTHNFIAQTYLRFRNKVFNTLDQKRVTIEFTIQILMMAALIIYAGPKNFLWIFILPLFVQNYLLMSYISTNHNISPLTSENDPLANSITVTNNPILEYLTVNFGYHVEHHIFPTVNGVRIKEVHQALKKNFPKEFIHMPKWKAIRALYASPRIYKNSRELIHPETLKTTKISELY